MKTSEWQTISVGTDSRVRIRPGYEDKTPGNRLKPATTGFIGAADAHINRVAVVINPAIVWEGTCQEFTEHWETVPNDTPLTF